MRKNFPVRREQRKAEAEVRQADFESLKERVAPFLEGNIKWSAEHIGKKLGEAPASVRRAMESAKAGATEDR